MSESEQKEQTQPVEPTPEQIEAAFEQAVPSEPHYSEPKEPTLDTSMQNLELKPGFVNPQQDFVSYIQNLDSHGNSQGSSGQKTEKPKKPSLLQTIKLNYQEIAKENPIQAKIQVAMFGVNTVLFVAGAYTLKYAAHFLSSL